MTSSIRRTAQANPIQPQQLFSAKAANIGASAPIGIGQGYEKHDYTKLERTTSTAENNANNVINVAFPYFDQLDKMGEFAWIGK